MSMEIQVPPINRPTAAQSEQWEDWSEKELLVALVIRQNYMAGLIGQMAQDLPEMMRSPMVKMASKMFLKADKSNARG